MRNGFKIQDPPSIEGSTPQERHDWLMAHLSWQERRDLRNRCAEREGSVTITKSELEQARAI